MIGFQNNQILFLHCKVLKLLKNKHIKININLEIAHGETVKPDKHVEWREMGITILTSRKCFSKPIMEFGNSEFGDRKIGVENDVRGCATAAHAWDVLR